MAAATQPQEIYFNPWDEKFRADPYPYYRPLLAGPPRLLNLFVPMALVARYADTATILRDPGRFSSLPPRTPYIEERLQIFGSAPRIVFSDPPIHTRLRRLVSRAFTPRRIKDFEPRIREITNGLLDRVPKAGGFDLMDAIANPLPVIVIAEMLGVPAGDHAQFKTWSNQIIEGGRMAFGGANPAESVKTSSGELREYIAQQIERRRREPGEDLITALVQAHDEGGALAADELLAFVVLLLLAGNETTTH